MLAVYTARNSSMALYQRLKSERIRCNIVSTPRQITSGCSLSVRFNDNDFFRVKNHINAISTYSFAGIWKENGRGYARIY